MFIRSENNKFIKQFESKADKNHSNILTWLGILRARINRLQKSHKLTNRLHSITQGKQRGALNSKAKKQ